MNTPAHVVLSGLALGAAGRRRPLPVLAGALVPDLPMFGFYLYQRVGRGIAEAEIWSTLYFDPSWQLFFDLFNSIPLAALGALAAWWWRRPGWLLFCASLLLHALTDLPLHREDAHAHFLPFTHWRFVSPVSYWDPAHYGGGFAALEVAGVVLGSAVLLRRGGTWRVVGAVCLLATAALAVFALLFWL